MLKLLFEFVLLLLIIVLPNFNFFISLRNSLFSSNISLFFSISFSNSFSTFLVEIISFFSVFSLTDCKYLHFVLCFDKLDACLYDFPHSQKNVL